VLAKFSKFPFEHFAWDKHCYIIIRWAWSLKIASWERHGKPNSLCLLREKNVGLDLWKNGHSTPGGGRFSASSLTIVGNGASVCSGSCIASWGACNSSCATSWRACKGSCVASEECSNVVGNGSWDNAHTSNLSNKSERVGEEPSTLVQCVIRTCGSSEGWTGRATANAVGW
jgi:hypothetical protein